MTTSTVVTLAAWLLLATSHAHPHQVYYQGAPDQQAASFIYVPQADAANVASVQQYSAPLAVQPPATQYVLLYPGGQQDNLLPRADEEKPSELPPASIWNFFNLFGTQQTTPAPTTTASTTTAKSITTPEENTPTSTVATRVEETTPKSVAETPVKPEKIVGSTGEIMVIGDQFGTPSNEQRGALENLDESFPLNPQLGDPSSSSRKYMLVQRPQFFGNYNLLKQANMQQNFGLPAGAVPNVLLYRNGFAHPDLHPTSSSQSGRPLKLQEEEGVDRPGVAALKFQQDLQSARRREGESQDESVGAPREVQPVAHIATPVAQSGVFFQPESQYYLPAPVATQFVTSEVGSHGLVSFRHTIVPNQQVLTSVPGGETAGLLNVAPGYQNVYLLTPRQVGGGQEVVVEADRPKKGDKEDSEGVDAEQAGPSVAQAKPQAIALAGVGGVAAAAPVATAVVGNGGLAVSAPSATAVAGPSGGGTLVGTPAHGPVVSVNKHLLGVDKTRQGTFQRDEDRHFQR